LNRNVIVLREKGHSFFFLLDHLAGHKKKNIGFVHKHKKYLFKYCQMGKL